MLVGETVEDLRRFVEYTHSLEGDEKGEAQVFCDRLFRAFGHQGYKEADAKLEYRVREKGKRTKYADLLWKPRRSHNASSLRIVLGQTREAMRFYEVPILCCCDP